MSTLLTEKEFLDLLANHASRFRSVRAQADDLGVNFRMLNKVNNGSAPPGIAIPAAFGYEPVTMYRKIRKPRNGRK